MYTFVYICVCMYLCIYIYRQWHPTPVLLPGKSHGRRSLVGCRPWGRWELDTTERLHFHFSLSRIGEGNGNPLQCSCLENPRDRGAWWVAVSRVAQSRTPLKWLSSSIHRFFFDITVAFVNRYLENSQKYWVGQKACLDFFHHLLWKNHLSGLCNMYISVSYRPF